MRRPAIAALVILVLALGVGVGLGAGLLARSESGGPVAAVTLPSPGAVPTGSGSTARPTTSTNPASAEPTAAPSPTPEPTPSPTPSPIPEPTPKLVPAPLTGRLVTEAVAERHVIAVMVDDLSAARPQSGLSQADIVWQAPAEGGIARYLAMFQDTDPTSVGPIRSSRLYFIAWASEWKSVYAHSGGSPQALALLRSADGRGKVVYNADEFRWSRYLYRVRYRRPPHNIYSDAESLRNLAARVGAKSVADQAPKWQFAADAPLEQRPSGGKIVVPYLANRITYSYDRQTNTYPRSVSVEGKQFDAGVKPRVRVAPSNVVVMQVRFIPLGDAKKRLDGQVTGTGTAWIATNGTTVMGTWKKKSFTSPTRFFGPDGNEVTLTIGQTFIQVVPTGTKITIKDGTVPVPEASPGASPSSSPGASSSATP
jgi:hypothetical protein